MSWAPCLVELESGQIRLGHPLVDRYLEFVAARGRRNTLLAAAYDLKVFFSVVAKDPVDVTTADVLDFITVQRGDRRVVRLSDGESDGLSARTTQVAADTPSTTSTAPEGTSTILAEGEQASWPRSGFEPGDPRLFFPTIVVDEGIATLEVLFLDGSSVEMWWPSDLDLVSGGLRPYSVAYMMSLQGDHGIFRDLTVERGDVVEMATRMGAPNLVANYPDGRGGSVGYWSGGQESGGVQHLSYQFGGWALLVPDWPGAGGMSDEEREIWAMHLHGEETENGLLRLTLDRPLRFAYDWMTIYLESPGGTVTLDLAECSPTYEEAFEQTQIWCDESGLLIVQVTGDKDFRESVRADLDLVAIDPSDEFGMREEES